MRKKKTAAPLKIVFIFLITLISLEVVFILANNFKLNKTPKSLEYYADLALSKCKDAPYRPTCYDEEIPKFMAEISMEDAFKVTKLVQKQDTNYNYCHVLGHKLSAREVAKDPSKWRDVLTRCPSGTCSNGCLHGGLQERFRKDRLSDKEIEKLKPDLESLCEPRGNWDPTQLEKASCYHALGHLTMYMTSADIPKSISLCEDLALKKNGRDWRQICFDGVFMQIFQPLEPEDFALVKGKQPTRETVDEFCNNYDGTKKASCQSESWPLFFYDIRKPEGLVEFCSKAEPNSLDRCFTAMFYILTAEFKLDQDRVYDFCSSLIKDRQAQCFANAASRMIEVDYGNISKAIDLCNRAKEFDPEGKCYDEMVLYSDYNFHRGSSEFYNICNSLPDPWNSRCLGN